MRLVCLMIGVIFGIAFGATAASAAEWRRFVIPSTGASAEIPISIFNDETELPEGGVGRRLYTADRRADLTVQSIANSSNESPAAFLAKKNPPPGFSTRVTPKFSLYPASERTEYGIIAAIGQAAT